MNSNELTLLNLGNIEPKPVEWLVEPIIPLGKITVICGDPGSGKTTFAIKLASDISNGINTLNHAKEKCTPGTVVFQSSEDSANDTLRSRFSANNANLANIVFIDETNSPLSLTDKRLEDAIKLSKAKIVVVDPLQNYLPKIDMHRANEVRPVFSHLAKLAEKYNCAIILISHLNKGNGKALYRSLGSIDLIAACRSNLVISAAPDNPEIKIVAQAKNSLAPLAASIAFTIEENSKVQWVDYKNISADELLESSNSKYSVAQKFLLVVLADSSISCKEILALAKEKDICERTLRKAKKELKIKSKKKKNEWVWELPIDDSTD